MIKYDIQRLSDVNKYLIDNFSCVETDEMLAPFKSKDRRRIRKHSLDMERFLREEAFAEDENDEHFYELELHWDTFENIMALMNNYKHIG